MKTVIMALSVLTIVGFTLAQARPAPEAAVKEKDTAQHCMAAPDKCCMPMCPHEGPGFQGERGGGFRPGPDRAMRHPGMGPGCGNGPGGELGMDQRPPARPFFFHCPPPPRGAFPFGLILLLLLGTMNILLTVIVSADMTRGRRFNGLWIPVLLIAGIPGAAIYALFRIGDRLPCDTTLKDDGEEV
jgi:hypothetical protein